MKKYYTSNKMSNEYKSYDKNIFGLFFLLLIPNVVFYIYLDEFRTTIFCSNLILMLVICLLYKNKYSRILSITGLLLFVVNNGIAMFNVVYYRDLFNISMALSILSTNSGEALEMLKEYYFIFLLGTAYFALLFCIVRKQPLKNVNVRLLLIISVLLTILPSYRLHTTFLSTNFGAMSKTKTPDYLMCTPIYSFSPFIEAISFLNQVQYLENLDFNYPDFTTKPNDLENIVVVIGESARKDALSLYGNSYKTTPLIEKRIDNLYVYDHAISASPFTNAAVSLLLSRQLPNSDFKVENNLDNIISLANQSKVWETYWLSTQENLGVYVNLFSVLSYKAKNKKWIHKSKFDEEIVPAYSKALQDSNQKRLIFIHINGSHPIFSKRYPESFEIFKEKSQNTNEYFNSIYYTDFVLDKLIKKLEKTNSILLYVSDHGLTNKENKLMHSPTKKALEVPFFIWHSDRVNDEFKKSGRTEIPISTTNLYNILMDYMGIEGIEYKGENAELNILKPNFKVVKYKDLEDGE